MITTLIIVITITLIILMMIMMMMMMIVRAEVASYAAAALVWPRCMARRYSHSVAAGRSWPSPDSYLDASICLSCFRLPVLLLFCLSICLMI